MNLKYAFIFAITIGVFGLGSWELYWRSQGKTPLIQDDNALWSVNRSRVEKLNTDDFVFVGSSRVHFDIQLKVWEAYTQKKPVQLAMGGGSPLPTFRDIVRNTDFKGTILVGVTPPLFFSSTSQQAPPISGPQEKVDYYKDQTYAQQFNHWLSMPLQRNFAFVHSFEDMMAGNIDLRSLLQRIKIGNRTGKPTMPPFFEFGESSEYRNVRMIDKYANDPTWAQTVIDVWMFCLKGNTVMPPPDKEATTTFFLEDLKIFQERGGRVILVRCPSSNEFREIEAKITPRTEFWDELVEKSGVPAYHFEDYAQLQGLRIPEWSHLAAEDADIFTKELLKIMENDNVLTNE